VFVEVVDGDSKAKEEESSVYGVFYLMMSIDRIECRYLGVPARYPASLGVVGVETAGQIVEIGHFGLGWNAYLGWNIRGYFRVVPIIARAPVADPLKFGS
jgi:hypothetical protein